MNVQDPNRTRIHMLRLPERYAGLDDYDLTIALRRDLLDLSPQGRFEIASLLAELLGASNSALEPIAMTPDP